MMHFAQPVMTMPRTQARRAVERVLQAVWRHDPLIVVPSPPGAGKTSLAIAAAGLEFVVHGGRVLLAAQTNAQALDLGRRCARRFPSQSITLLVRSSLPIPKDISLVSNLQVIRRQRNLPTGPCLVITTSAKAAWLQLEAASIFTLLIIDEAYQMTDYRYALIAPLGQRHLLIGDPGQIEPVVRVPPRWDQHPIGPQTAAPIAVTHRRDATIISLPHSYRLPADTVALLQPACYPQLPYGATTDLGTRRLSGASTVAQDGLDRALALACAPSSLVGILVEGTETRSLNARDAAIAHYIIALIHRLLAPDITLVDGEASRVLTAADVGVVCAHISQVHVIRRMLPQSSPVLVETAERWQGLERAVVLAWHPLAGLSELDAFHLHPGRLSVMISRHTTVCFLLGETRLPVDLSMTLPDYRPALDGEEVVVLQGWAAHQAISQGLVEQTRVVTVPPPG